MCAGSIYQDTENFVINFCFLFHQLSKTVRAKIKLPRDEKITGKLI